MTPKEKAQDLLSKFFPDLKHSLELELIGVRKKHAKKYALIAVDEILEELFEMAIVTGSSYVHKHIDYYKEVKQEIENL